MKNANASIFSTLAKRSQGQIIMLTLQFLLGMAVNLIGVPDEATGAAKSATSIFLGLHMLIAIGLIVGAFLTIRLAKQAGAFGSMAWTGAVLVIVTVTAGVLTSSTDNNWWSYLMAVGFMLSILLYGSLFARAKSRV